MEQVDLCFVEGCARVCHHILYAALVHGEHISVALHHIHHILFGYLLLGLEDTIEFVCFMVDEGVGRVDIFLTDSLGACIKHSATKSNHFAVHRNPREHGASTKTVIDGAIITFHTESSVHQILLIVSFCLCLVRHGIGAVEAKTETELGDDVVSEAAAPEIGKSDGTTVLVGHHGLAEILGGPFVDGKHALSLIHLLPLFVGHFFFFNWDAIFLCQMF